MQTTPPTKFRTIKIGSVFSPLGSLRYQGVGFRRICTRAYPTPEDEDGGNAIKRHGV